MAWELWRPYQGYGQPIFVVIAPGTHRATIATQLARAGVIHSRFPFVLICLLKPKQSLKAGEYYFQKPLSPYEVFEKVARGEVYQHGVAVPEGMSMSDIGKLFEREGLVTADSFLEAARDVSLISDLAPEATNLEGYLFPDTYAFPMGVSANQIVAAMVQRFRQVFEQFGPHGRNPYSLPVHGLVTMASLVEKETSNSQERFLIAGVFYNRLRRGVALQCDPTVIYAARLLHRFNGTIDRQTLAIKSPYNTYRNRGLPPGPIANPGKGSLEAALYPPYVDYLYFVSNTQGGHFFSRTLEQHSQNVARYRHLLTQQALNRDGAGQALNRNGAGQALNRNGAGQALNHNGSGQAQTQTATPESDSTSSSTSSQAAPPPPKKASTAPQPPQNKVSPRLKGDSSKKPKNGSAQASPKGAATKSDSSSSPTSSQAAPSPPKKAGTLSQPPQNKVSPKPAGDSPKKPKNGSPQASPKESTTKSGSTSSPTSSRATPPPSKKGSAASEPLQQKVSPKPAGDSPKKPKDGTISHRPPAGPSR